MSFWPFHNTLGNSLLQKFLESVSDVTLAQVDDLLNDAELLEEILNELNTIKESYNNKLSGFQFLPAQHSDTMLNPSTSIDSISLTSSNTDNLNYSSKDTQGAKLLELIIQPHILAGLIDYLVRSVDFFYEKRLKDEEELEVLIANSPDKATDTEVKLKIETVHQLEDAEEDKEHDEEVESEDDTLIRKIETASSILQIDLWVILNRIIETPFIMSKLWGVLSLPKLQETSPTVVHIVGILAQLMATNSVELLNFMRRQPNLVDTLLSKIEIPAIMDFFLQVIQTDKPDSPTGILETLAQQDLIVKIIDILKPDPSQFATGKEFPNPELFFKQTTATDFIKALVTISANTALAVSLETNIGPNQLTRELVSPKIINTMINDIMLYEVPESVGLADRSNKHGINNCVGIIIELIRKNNLDYDLNCGSYSSLLQNGETGASEITTSVMFQWLKDFDENPPGARDPIYLGDMLEIFSNNLDKFTVLMDAPTNGKNEEKTLGFTKFKISELIAELLHCSNMILLNSKKIRKLIHIRDKVRVQQATRLQRAINETISFTESDSSLHEVTNGLDDVSLDDITLDGTTNGPSNTLDKLIEAIDNEHDSDDEEPSISPENPFVCEERDQTIRMSPCVGDYFKIRLVDLGILLNIVRKFTKFPWHNFFHNVVFDLIQQIFNGKLNSYNSFLIVDLFKPTKNNLTGLIVKLYKTASDPRPGYMGHLILISEEVVKFTSLYKPDIISPVIVDAIQSDDWEWFVRDVLLKTRQVYNVVLGADQEAADQEHEGEYAYDSSTVGYLDLDNYDENNDKHVIILGDASNHNDFVNDNNQDDENMEENVCDVEVQNMTPKGNMMTSNDDSVEDGDQNHYEANPNTDSIDTLSGSSSSDEDINDEEINDDDLNEDEDTTHELRRVPRHHEK